MAGRPKKIDYNSTAWRNKLYQLIKENLADIGYVEQVDEHMVRLYIGALSNAYDAQEKIREEGKTIVNSKGDTVLNPLWRTYKESMGMVQTFSNSLGLSAAARKKIGMAIEQEIDPINLFTNTKKSA